MTPLLTPPSMAGASLAHRRWRAHRLMLALTAGLVDDRYWASAACGVNVAGRVHHPAVVVASGEPPQGGVLTRAPLLVVEFDDEGLDVEAWRRHGAATAWRLRDDHVEVADHDGRRSVTPPTTLHTAVAGVTVCWPLPASRPRSGRSHG